MPLLRKNPQKPPVVLVREDIDIAVRSLADVPHAGADGELLLANHPVAVQLDAADLAELQRSAEEVAPPADLGLGSGLNSRRDPQP